ncbi:hypothetical protein [Piscinibacter sp.]|uniref:hypothetical protein n=1 Tax=Piscinibacter sp. TaxID=1903157 RepID=UPI002C798E7B|nr:hypothetical protein [Albitalea sp.]HUG23212.1 hypothetical protein [Albitalea sp.]
MRRLLPLFVLWAGSLGAAHAEPSVYRCGNVYSQTPCDGGRQVDTADPRSAEQQAQARRAAAVQSAQAAEMERDRLAQAVAHTPATANGFNGRPPRVDTAASAPKGKSRKKLKP